MPQPRQCWRRPGCHCWGDGEEKQGHHHRNLLLCRCGAHKQQITSCTGYRGGCKPPQPPQTPEVGVARTTEYPVTRHHVLLPPPWECALPETTTAKGPMMAPPATTTSLRVTATAEGPETRCSPLAPTLPQGSKPPTRAPRTGTTRCPHLPGSMHGLCTYTTPSRKKTCKHLNQK